MIYFCSNCHKLCLYPICNACYTESSTPITFKNVSYTSIMQSRGCWSDDIFQFIKTKRIDEISKLLFDSIALKEQSLARNIKSEVMQHKYTVNRDTNTEKQLIRAARLQTLPPFELECAKVEQGGIGVFKFKRPPILFDAVEILYILRIAKISSTIADCEITKTVQNTRTVILGIMQIQITHRLDKEYLKDILVQCDAETILSVDNLKSVS